MATPTDVIKEYLVRLGFDFDTGSLNRVLNEISAAQNRATSMITKMSRSIGAAFAGISSVIVSANVALGAFVTNVAQADLQTQIAARRMYMNTDAYRSMEQAAEALGYTMDDLTDIAMSPELTSQFKELVLLSQETVAPRKLDDQLKQVRSIMFEFNRLKILVQNGMRQVASEFLDILGEDLKTIKQNLNSFVNRIQDQLPKISRGIAELLVHVLRAGNMLLNVIRYVGQLSNRVFEFLNKFPGALKVMLVAAGAAFVALNPVLATTVAGVTGLMALIDDYMVWTQGGNSFFGDKWQDAQNIGNRITSVVATAFEKIYFGVGKLKELLLNNGSDIIDGYVSNAKTGIGAIINYVQTDGKEALSNILSNGKIILQGAIEPIKNVLGSIGRLLEKVLPDVLNIAGTLVDNVFQLGADILPSLMNALSNTFGIIADVVGEIIHTLTPHVTNLISQLREITTTIFNKVITPLIEIFNKFLQGVSPTLTRLLDKIGEAISEHLMPAINKIIDVLAPVLKWLIEYFLTWLAQGIKLLGTILENFVINPITWIADSIGTIFSDAKLILGELFSGILDVNSMTEKWGDVLDSIWSVLGKILKGLKWILFPITGATDFADWMDDKTGWRDKLRERQENGITTGDKIRQSGTDYFGNIVDLDAYNNYRSNYNANKAMMIDSLNTFYGKGNNGYINGEDKILGNYEYDTTNNNTNNNHVTQNITVNQASMSNPFGMATNMANNILKSMMLSPVIR